MKSSGDTTDVAEYAEQFRHGSRGASASGAGGKKNMMNRMLRGIRRSKYLWLAMTYSMGIAFIITRIDAGVGALILVVSTSCFIIWYEGREE